MAQESIYTHSHLARRYAAYERNHPLGRAYTKSLTHYSNAVAAQAAHWQAVQAHVRSAPERVEQT